MEQKTNLSELLDILSKEPDLAIPVLDSDLSTIIKSKEIGIIKKVIEIFKNTNNYNGIARVYDEIDDKEVVLQQFREFDNDLQINIAREFLQGPADPLVGLEFAVLADDYELIKDGASKAKQWHSLEALQIVAKTKDYELVPDLFIKVRKHLEPGYSSYGALIRFKQENKDPIEGLYQILQKMEDPQQALKVIAETSLSNIRAIKRLENASIDYELALEFALRNNDPKLILDVSLEAAHTKDKKDSPFRSIGLVAYNGFKSLLEEYSVDKTQRGVIAKEMKEMVEPLLRHNAVEAALYCAKMTGEYEPVRQYVYRKLGGGYHIDEANVAISSILNLNIDEDAVIGIANSVLDKVNEEKDLSIGVGYINRAIRIAGFTDKTLNKAKLSQAIKRMMSRDKKGVKVALGYLTERDSATPAQAKLYQAMQQRLI